MKTLKIIFALSSLIAIITMARCKKENVLTKHGDITVMLDEMSGPNDVASGVDQVVSLILHVKSIDIHFSDALEDQWVHIKTREGLYDLIQLQGDSIATLASGTLVVGEISAMRLVLGDKNSVIVRGDSERALIIPSYLQNWIVFELNASIISNWHLLTAIYIDPAQSLVKNGNNYVFIPKAEVRAIIR